MVSPSFAVILTTNASTIYTPPQADFNRSRIFGLVDYVPQAEAEIKDAIYELGGRDSAKVLSRGHESNDGEKREAKGRGTVRESKGHLANAMATATSEPT